MMEKEPIEKVVTNNLSLFICDIKDNIVFSKFGNPNKDSMYYACHKKKPTQQKVRELQDTVFIQIHKFKDSRRRTTLFRGSVVWTKEEFNKLREYFNG